MDEAPSRHFKQECPLMAEYRQEPPHPELGCCSYRFSLCWHKSGNTGNNIGSKKMHVDLHLNLLMMESSKNI